MKRLTTTLLPLVAVLAALAAAGCGGPSEPDEGALLGKGRWRHARLAGVTNASGLAWLDGHLLVVTGSERVVHAVPFDPAAAARGAELPSRAVPITPERDAQLAGGEEFGLHGYRLGDLWAVGTDFQGIAAQAPDFVFLGDRVHRVVYAGRFLQTPEREWRALRLDRVFTVPGAARSASAASDWRDKGPGLAGLAAVQGMRLTEDLYAVERGEPGTGTFRIHALDRFGFPLGTFTVDLSTPGVDADVGGILREEKRFLFVRGEGRGMIHPVRKGRWHERVKAGRGAPGPEVAGAGRWTGMTRLPDGTLVLVSGGGEAYVAWRAP